ncbi:MAG: hypothetical protein DCF32_02985 [Leptolyngbya sp.]|nr:MAG: hypothetical protein DCF32_02985 [Leptolyngbya sp.]
MSYGVNIVGPVFGELGIGEDVRQLAHAILSLGIPISIINYPRTGNFAESNYHSLESYVTNRFSHNCSIFCLPLIESYRFFLEFGSAKFQNRYNIGYAAWELESWPVDFAFIGSLFDEIWASSAHTYQAYQANLKQPIYRIPLIVSIADSVSLENPSHFTNIDQSKFNFLYAFDSNSTFSRKNPWDAVIAFQKAFDQESHVSLVLKTMHYQNNDQELNKLLENNKNIVLINKCFSRLDMFSLYKACDAYVSLHKAEGFGRTIAESMLLKRPTIISNYSGNTDFCTKENSFLVDGKLEAVAPFSYPFWQGNRWFSPDLDSATAQMYKCFSNPSMRNSIVETAFQSIVSDFSIEKVRKDIYGRLSKILKRF